MFGLPYSQDVLVAATATGLLHYGNSPAPPRVVSKFFEANETLKWLMVFLLVWQGNGRQDIQLTLIVVAVLYVAKMVLDRLVPE